MADLRPQMSRMFVFARVVQRGSFAAAARDLGVSRSLASETVAELEREVGVRLLERTTRAVRLTHDGQRFFERCSHIVRDTEEALSDVTNSARGAAGTLRVTCSAVVVEALIAPVLADITRAPGLRVELVVDDQQRDLVADGFDVGVRVGVPPESDFIARFIGAAPDLVVASPELVRGLALDDLEAVRALPWITHSALPQSRPITAPDGAARTLRLDPAIVVNTAESQRALLLAGAGASVAIRPLVEDLLRAGRLTRLLPSWGLRSMQVFALMPSTRQQPMRVRLFVDALVARAAEMWGERAPGARVAAAPVQPQRS